jgi:hypothetical protein
MKLLFKTTMIGAAFIAAFSAYAQAPAGAPAGTTGLCKDGSYYSGPTKKGACRGHKGVKDWYGATATAPATASAPAAAATPAPTPAAAAAAGGGPGLVWVNASSKVYHCPNDKWYGKTKQGEYMSEADAKAKGYHSDHGKACQ